MKRLKQEKGSITLFVVVSMLFFVLFLAGIYMIATSKEQTGISETKRIKEIYEKDINRIDDVYQTVEEGLKQNLKDVIKVGDYVAYDPTKGVANKDLLSYTSEIGTGMSHGNGHSSQTFTATNETKWRVFSKDDQTGEIVLISETPIGTNAKTDFYMKGAIGYLYAEQELNEICKIYGYGIGANTLKTFTYETGDIVEGVDKGTITGSGARSIKVEDVNAVTGFDPKTDSNYRISYTHTIYHPTKQTSTGISKSAVTRTDIQEYYSYKGVNYLTDIESAVYQILFRSINNLENISYWLASHCIATATNYADFCIRNVEDGKIYSSWGSGNDNSFGEHVGVFGIRPLVYLKSSIQTTGKDESGAWMISE